MLPLNIRTSYLPTMLIVDKTKQIIPLAQKKKKKIQIIP